MPHTIIMLEFAAHLRADYIYVCCRDSEECCHAGRCVGSTVYIDVYVYYVFVCVLF